MPATRAISILIAAFLSAVALPGNEPPPEAKDQHERIERLVEAGALPRNTLQEAERDLDRAGWEQTIRETLLRGELTVRQLPAMLRAAEGLRDLTREALRKTTSLVEAGAIPANRLAPVKKETELAERQYELAVSRARLVRERAEMVRAESYLDELQEEELAFQSEWGFERETFTYWEEELLAIDAAFYEQFGRPLPISAQGDTVLHRSLGFNHVGRADIALHPDQEEGMFLLWLLDSWDIPYIAFRSSVPGQSTGPHIHIGPKSDPIPWQAPLP